MPNPDLAIHTPSHQFVKSGNVFGNDTVDGKVSARIADVDYEGIRFGAGGADAGGTLRITTEHGELQLQTGQGDRGFAGDYRFVLKIHGDVNEFLSDESLDLIERFEFTVQYEHGHQAKTQFAVNLIDVVYSGEHFLSGNQAADEAVPAGLLEPAAGLAALQDTADTAGAGVHFTTAETTGELLKSADLLRDDAGTVSAELDEFFGVERVTQAVSGDAAHTASRLGIGLDTARADHLLDSTPILPEG